MKRLFACAALALATAAFAEPSEGRGPRPPRGMEGPNDPIVRLVSNKKFAEKIGLSEEQKAKIAEINGAFRNSDDLRKTVGAAMDKQHELLKADKIDEAAVMAEIDKAYDARKEMAKRQTKRLIAIKTVLTPEQVKKALEAAKNHHMGGPRDPEARRAGEGPRCKNGARPGKGPKPRDKGNSAPAGD